MSNSFARRELIKVTALAGGGLALEWVSATSSTSVALADRSALGASPGSGVQVGDSAVPSGGTAVSPFAVLHSDNTMDFVLDRVEMGQGTATSQPMLLCEELSFPLGHVRIRQAPVAAAYKNGVFGSQMTGGSTSVVEGHEKLRQAGAEIRERLRLAAAQAWKQPIDDVVAEQGFLWRKSMPSVRVTYGSLAREAAAQPQPDTVLKPWGSQSLIGTSPRRIDSRLKSTGQPIYGIDSAPEGSAVAVFLHPPQHGREPADVDDTKASSMVGVLGVFKIANDHGGGVAVVAERYWQARAAADQGVKVTWRQKSPGQPFNMSTAELLETHRKAAGSEARSHRSEGNWAKTYRAATLKLQADYECPYLAHATMEPQNAVVQIFTKGPDSARSLRAEVWTGTQVPDLVVSEVAEVLSCDRSEVKLNNAFLGGGFGRRLRADVVVLATEIALAAETILRGRPLQLIYSREDDMKNDDYRPMAVTHMLASLDDKGKLSSFFCRVASQSIMRQHAPDLVQNMAPQWLPLGVSGAAAGLLARFMGHSVALEGIKDMAYGCPSVEVEYAEVDVPVRVGFWRSVGHSYTGFVVESFMDELAHLAQVDPYQFRKSHLAPGDRRGPVLDRVVALSGWGGPLPQGVFEGLAVHKSFGSYVAQVCRISVNGTDVRVHDVFCVVDCGRVVHPGIVISQMQSGIVFGLAAALAGEVQFEGGAVVQGNFHDYPVLRHDACPRIVTEILPSSEDPSGVGEPATPPIAAALANAIFKATGQRLRSLPVSRFLQAGGAAPK